ncbi:hypothetical protein AB7M37_001638 [Sinorhizobium fredii]
MRSTVGASISISKTSMPANFLKRTAFSFHHRLGGEGADIAEAEHGRAVRYDRDEIGARREIRGALRIVPDGEAGRGDARRIGKRQIALVAERLGGLDFELAGARVAMEEKCLLVDISACRSRLRFRFVARGHAVTSLFLDGGLLARFPARVQFHDSAFPSAGSGAPNFGVIFLKHESGFDEMTQGSRRRGSHGCGIGISTEFGSEIADAVHLRRPSGLEGGQDGLPDRFPAPPRGRNHHSRRRHCRRLAA